jgi:hypothetical protein
MLHIGLTYDERCINSVLSEASFEEKSARDDTALPSAFDTFAAAAIMPANLGLSALRYWGETL